MSALQDREPFGDMSVLTEPELYIVNTAFCDMYFRAKQVGLTLPKDGRAAALEAAFIRFMLDARSST